MKTYYQTSVEIAEKEVVIQRHFNAPRSLVYRAWTDPAMLMQWWGPHSFTLPVCEVDLRVDGLYRYVMRSPEGQDFPMVGRYVEIVPDEKLVTTDALDDHPQEWFDMLKGFMGVTQFSDPLDILVTTTFTEHRGGTLVTIRSTFSSNAVRDGFIKMGMGEGWAESLDKEPTIGRLLPIGFSTLQSNSFLRCGPNPLILRTGGGRMVSARPLIPLTFIHADSGSLPCTGPMERTIRTLSNTLR